MPKKSRRQRQRAKQRNYDQLHHQTTAKSAPAATSKPIAEISALSPTQAASPGLAGGQASAAPPTLIRMRSGKQEDMWDSLIFAGAIFVSFIVIYYINLRAPFLPQFGTWFINLMGFSL